MDKLNEALQEILPRWYAITMSEKVCLERFERLIHSTRRLPQRPLNIRLKPAYPGFTYVTNVAIPWFGGQMIVAGRLGVGELTYLPELSVLLIMNSYDDFWRVLRYCSMSLLVCVEV